MAAKKEAAAVSSAPQKKKAQAQNSGKTITLVQIGSPIGRTKDQRATLIGLGLNKIRRQSVLQDTPAIRGMIGKVQHLVEVIGE